MLTKKTTLFTLILLIPLSLCAQTKPTFSVSKSIEEVKAKVGSGDLVADINHHALAQEAGVPMPPCRLLMFHQAKSELPIIEANPKAAIDLPYRCLSYLDGETPKTLITDSAWLKARFGLEQMDTELKEFDSNFATFGAENFTRVGNINHDGEMLTKEYGLLSIHSDFDFQTSLERLKKVIMSQDDTVWFGSIDFKESIKDSEVAIPPCTLLLFGGPAPGGVAMAKFPKLGLDAFCQKILLLEEPNGKITLYYNSIERLAEFHYGTAAKPHKMLDKRIGATYLQALKK